MKRLHRGDVRAWKTGVGALAIAGAAIAAVRHHQSAVDLEDEDD
ncbi:hypothetical protein [Capsulimonas corticalis]|nr:hypothetical protein [Capsulimonas corticalis]